VAYEVFGELGRETDSDIWYLGRDRESKRLVALRLRQIGVLPDGRPDYELEIADELDATVSVGAGDCPHCGAAIRKWARFCTQCGKDLSLGGANPSSPGDRAALLEEVRIAAQGTYDVLGEMPWAGGGGIVYFALEARTNRLVRLRLRDSDDGLELGETRALPHLGDRLSASYVTKEFAGGRPVGKPENDEPTSPDSTEDTVRRPDVLPPVLEIGGRQYDAMTLVKFLAATTVVLIILVIVLLLKG